MCRVLLVLRDQEGKDEFLVELKAGDKDKVQDWYVEYIHDLIALGIAEDNRERVKIVDPTRDQGSLGY